MIKAKKMPMVLSTKSNIESNILSILFDYDPKIKREMHLKNVFLRIKKGQLGFFQIAPSNENRTTYTINTTYCLHFKDSSDFGL